jgi:hypothetical protein
VVDLIARLKAATAAIEGRDGLLRQSLQEFRAARGRSPETLSPVDGPDTLRPLAMSPERRTRRAGS